MRYIVSLLVNALIIIISGYIIPSIHIDSFGSAVWAALLIGILNVSVGFLMRLIFNVLSLGLFWITGLGFIIRWIVNAIVIQIADSWMSGFEVSGFGAALILSLILSGASVLTESMLENSTKQA